MNAALPWKMCVTLRSTPERKRHAEAQFRRAGWTVPFLDVDRDDEDPERGCYASHVEVMRRALAAGVPHALVMEDDVVLRRHAAAEREVAEFLRSGAPFDVLLLGGCGSNADPQQCATFAPIPGYSCLFTSDCLCTHAVIYSRAFMESFVRMPYAYYPIDDLFVEMGARIVVVRPRLATQNKAFPSTIEWDADPTMAALCVCSIGVLILLSCRIAWTP